MREIPDKEEVELEAKRLVMRMERKLQYKILDIDLSNKVINAIDSAEPLITDDDNRDKLMEIRERFKEIKKKREREKERIENNQERLMEVFEDGR